MGINILHEAFRYINEGYAVIPCNPKTKRPLVRWSVYQTRKPTEAEWQQWFIKWRDCNLGLITGFYHNRVVLDFDTEREFDLWFTSEERHLPLPMIIKTGRGYHVHYTTQQAPGRSFIARTPDDTASVEIKARGNFVVVPPSIHTSGQVYRIINHARQVPMVIKNIYDVLGPFEQKKAKQLELPISTNGNGNTTGIKTKVDAIKATFKVEQFIKDASDRPDSRGRHAARCPLPNHTDNHTSFWFHPVDQVCACARCTNGGTWDVINLYAEMHSLTNRQAIDELYQLTPQGLRGEK